MMETVPVILCYLEDRIYNYVINGKKKLHDKTRSTNQYRVVENTNNQRMLNNES